MNSIVYGIVAFNLLIVWEVVSSPVWRSKRISMSCVKTAMITILITSVMTIVFSVINMILEIGSSVPQHFFTLLLAMVIMYTLSMHQIVYIVNRRRIFKPRER